MHNKCIGLYGNLISKCLGTVSLLVLYRGSGQEVGRSCHILEFKGKKVMVCTCRRIVVRVAGAWKYHVRKNGVCKRDMQWEQECLLKRPLKIVSHHLLGRHFLLLLVTPSRIPFILVSISSTHLLCNNNNNIFYLNTVGFKANSYSLWGRVKNVNKIIKIIKIECSQ